MSVAASALAACPHCGAPSRDGAYCCSGCAAAAQLAPQPTPSHGLIAAVPQMDYSRFINRSAEGCSMVLMVEGMRCAACAFAIERVLNAEPQVQARLNLTTRRLNLRWSGAPERAQDLIAKVAAQGYQLMPFDAEALATADKRESQFLLRCLAVSGFAAGNIMIIADALWVAENDTMGQATRDLLHWLSALIALPTVIYAGRPFFASAWQALRHRTTNMDVPIAVALVLTSVMSVVEMLRHGTYVYFDCVTMLLFLLLSGRFLDRQARGRARNAAQNLLALTAGTAVVLEAGQIRLLPVADLAPGMVLQVACGERITADGIVVQGKSELDPSLMTGETLTTAVQPGDKVYSGMVNLAAPLQIKVTAVGQNSLIGSMIQLMERAEQGHAHYVRLADKIAHAYTPVVHLLALSAFLLWWLGLGAGWQPALLTATTVLIITCPCALGLAVPAVQVLASSVLFKRGMLLKSGDALERLATVDTIVFDKTGTLTLGKPALVNGADIPPDMRALAAALAAYSRHPLAQALVAAVGENTPVALTAVQEHAGCGMSAIHARQTVRLGRRDWCGDSAAPADEQPELWLHVETLPPVRFVFADQLRSDSVAVCAALRQQGYQLHLLSGDRPSVAAAVAQQLGITEWQAGMTPVEKSAAMAALRAKGHRVLMVGDGLNDAPALAGADVALSPATALDIAQNAADLVFQGEKLAPVVTALSVAQRAQRLVRQNFLLALLYNIVAIPLAMAGEVTPLIAAVAMASSSVLVVLNAQRVLLNGRAPHAPTFRMKVS